MVVGGTTAVSSFVPELQALSIPYLFKDYDVFKKATAKGSTLVKMYQGYFEDHDLNLVLLGLSGGGLRNVSTTCGPSSPPRTCKA